MVFRGRVEQLGTEANKREEFLQLLQSLTPSQLEIVRAEIKRLKAVSGQ